MNSNIKSLANIFKQEGTARSERYLPALNPANISIDNRKLQDFIAYAQHYSKNVFYVNSETEEIDLKENWELFFKNDIISLIANVATKNADSFKNTYDHLSRLFREKKSFENFAEIAEFTFSRFKKINNWYYTSTPDASINSDLTLYISSYLKKDLEGLKEIIFYIRNIERNSFGTVDFKAEFFDNPRIHELDDILRRDNIWGIKDKDDIGLREQIFAGNDDEEKLFNALLVLDKIFESVFHATEALINNCRNYFEETFHEKQDHAPHITLFLVFIKLFGYVQDDLNKIPQRHLEFYYKEVLRIKAKEAIPDQAFVVFELAKGFGSYEIKKGTELTAGKDDLNKDLIYQTDDNIVINTSKVNSLHTIFIDKDENNQTLNYYSDQVGITSGKPPQKNDRRLTAWKMFGEKKQENVAEIGFAIASTQFYLAKGERDVTVTFGLLEPVGAENFDTSILKLLLSGEKGWLNSESTDSAMTIVSITTTSSRSLELRFKISIAQQSAIIAFDKKIHTGNFITSFPVLQCILKFPDLEEERLPFFEEKIKQLNILQGLRIASISIKVQVGSMQTKASFDGIKDLVLENGDSEIDNKKPFLPFTAIPKVGSSFYIGCKDLYYKKIQTLSINIEWMLPENFRDYYNKYLPPYDSNKFKASLNILQSKRWKKITDISIIEKNANDPRFRVIKIDFSKIKTEGLETEQEKALSSVNNEHKNGTLMLKLNYPDFGHGVYPQLITSAVMEKAASKHGAVDFYKIVKKQLHDSVISIKLPDDIESRTGTFKVALYDILEKVKDDDQAKTMMKTSLTDIITRFNGTNLILRSAGEEGREQGEVEGRTIVNDDNYLERILGFLKKIKLVDRNVHYDEDKQDAEEIINAVKDKINAGADFIMPSDKELLAVAMNETNSAISQTISNVVDQIISLRADRIPEPDVITNIFKTEFGEANDVINDMIARKIAILLSANEIPKPPYSPQITNISVNYLSVKSFEEGDDLFFHIAPSGVSKLPLVKNDIFSDSNNSPQSTRSFSIFPRAIVDNENNDAGPHGIIFISLSDSMPNQNLSILVQVAEGSKVNDKSPVEIAWWYLRNSNWTRLPDDNLISDSTYGLQTTGILKISIPGNIDCTTNLFNSPSLCWLCATVNSSTDAFPYLVDIKAQAACVTFKDKNNDPARLAVPLEAAKINNLVSKVPQVKKVIQPVSSFNGQVKEHDQEYYTRVSERLRHKERALNNWDYERLVIANFPFLYKVKCINNYYSGRFAVGHVTVVPVTDLRNRNYVGSNLLIPKTSYIDLRNIEKFLSARSSPFVKIHAVNPQLDHVLISCRVKFHSGVDKGYYLQKLNEEIIDFLTPWASGTDNLVSFSTKIYSSSIINFIDTREYINYVTHFIMKQYTENDDGEKAYCRDEHDSDHLIETIITTAHSILVSAPKHDIELVEE